jgi:hypothetical protein
MARSLVAVDAHLQIPASSSTLLGIPAGREFPQARSWSNAAADSSELAIESGGGANRFVASVAIVDFGCVNTCAVMGHGLTRVSRAPVHHGHAYQ